MINVVGIDLSLVSTGISVYHHTHIGHVREKITSKLRGVNRLLDLEHGIMDIVKLSTADVVGLEGYSMGSRGSRVFDIGELGGVIRLALLKENIPTLIIPPTSAKLYISGKGNCTKDVVIKELYKKYGVDENSNDLADAVVLQLVATHKVTCPAKETSYQKRAVDGCEWMAEPYRERSPLLVRKRRRLE